MISGTSYNPNIEDTADSLLDKPMRRKIFLSVSLAHVMLVILPFFFFLIYEKFTFKKPAIMRVNIANLSPPGPISKNPGKGADSPVKAPESKPVKTPDEPVMKPPPDKPAPVEPTVKSVPVKETKPEPIIKEPLVKTVPVPTDKIPKTETKPEKTEWTPLDATKITKSDKVVKGTNISPSQPAVSASSIADSLKKIQQQCKVTGSGDGGGDFGVNTGTTGTFSSQGTIVSNDYFDIVSAYLYKIWKQPLKSELGGAKPIVMVHINVDSGGNVRSSQISKSSGIPAMDKSVSELLKKITSIPAPPGGSAMGLDVSLEIIEE